MSIRPSVFAAVALSVTCLTACGQDESQQPAPEDTPEATSDDANAILDNNTAGAGADHLDDCVVGTFELEDTRCQPGNTECITVMETVTFGRQGTFSMEWGNVAEGGAEGAASGTWSTTDDRLTLDADDGEAQTWAYDCNDDELSLLSVEGGAVYTRR